MRLPPRLSITRDWASRMSAHIDGLPNKRLPITASVPNNLHVTANVKKDVKTAAVLIPLCHRHAIPSFIFTLRTNTVGTHRGEVSFPGGRMEPRETPIEAAKREFYEELGADVGHLEILGLCQTIPSITGTMVTPVLAFLDKDVDDFQHFNPSNNEVSKVFTRSLDLLCSPGYRTEEVRTRFNREFTMPVFGEGEERVWGLTAMILDAVMNKVVLPTYQPSEFQTP